jgi:hypothetical protein
VPEVTRPTPRDPAGLDGLVLIATKDVLSHPVQSCCSASSSDASKRKKVWNRPASLKDQRDSFRSKQNQARNCISPRNLSTRLEPAVAPSLSLRDYRPLRLLSQRDYNVTAHHLTTLDHPRIQSQGMRSLTLPNAPQDGKALSHRRTRPRRRTPRSCAIACRATRSSCERHGRCRGCH